jgi:acyl-CoA thioesterase I
MTKFKPDRRILFAFAAAALANCSAFAQQPFKIVAFGDSLSAGYNLPASAAFPVVLERALKARGLNVIVENAAVSGDTASAGRDRVDWSIQDDVRLVILELGANDALRGIDPKITEEALNQIIVRLKARRIYVLLAGMLAPPNNGPAYTEAFNGMYRRLADKHQLPLYPFFLDGVAADPKLNLPDGIHPTAAGVEEIVRRITPLVESTVRQMGG